MKKLVNKRQLQKLFDAVQEKFSIIRPEFEGMSREDWRKFQIQHFILAAKEKRYNIEATDQSYRVINHWCEIGLVDDSRAHAGKGWRQFSLIDLLWIKVIDELRAYGVSLEKIMKAKDFLFPFENGEKIELYFLSLMKPDHLLIVEKNGDVHLWQRKDQRKVWSVRSYIAINLYAIHEEFMASHFSLFKTDSQPEASVLNEAEQEFLGILRSGKYTSVSVKMKNGEIERFEMEENVNERIIDLIKSEDFQDISIKTEDGKIVSMKRVIKRKPLSRAMKKLQAQVPTKISRSSEKLRSGADHLHANR